jgi:hypothetical protein
MSINLQVFQESGALTGGRGTTVTEVTNWNMKDSASYAALYYPHDGSTSAPLIRPTAAGDLKLSYKVYTFFKLTVDAKIKNLKIKIQMDSAAQASKAMLFYKITNQYATPDNAFDGQMLPAYTGSAWSNGASEIVLWPNWSTTGPHLATSRSITYTGTSGSPLTLYSPYFVSQMYIPDSSSIGNSAEFKLRLECIEFGA